MPGDGKSSDEWSSTDKFRVVLEVAGLSEAELGEYCRRKGLYVEQVQAWRAACEQANATAEEQGRVARGQDKAARQRSKALEQEVTRKSAALAEAEAEAAQHHHFGAAARLRHSSPGKVRRRVFLLFLAPYSPELNRIESLWRSVNYQGLPIQAYQTFETLCREVCVVLNRYTSSCRAICV